MFAATQATATDLDTGDLGLLNAMVDFDASGRVMCVTRFNDVLVLVRDATAGRWLYRLATTGPIYGVNTTLSRDGSTVVGTVRRAQNDCSLVVWKLPRED